MPRAKHGRPADSDAHVQRKEPGRIWKETPNVEQRSAQSDRAGHADTAARSKNGTDYGAERGKTLPAAAADGPAAERGGCFAHAAAERSAL